MQTHRRIGLVCDFQVGFCRQILMGIRQYSLRRPNWIFFKADHSTRGIRQLVRNAPEGIIAFLFGKQEYKLLEQYGVPTVNVCGATPFSLPRVGLEDDAIGTIAAEHFINSGIKNLACFGHDKHAGAIRRETGFCRRANESKCNVSIYRVKKKLGFDIACSDWTRDALVLRWLKELPKPVGIFVVNDAWGIQLATSCQLKGIQVPKEVAILGLDNDQLACELSSPRLSSIAVPCERVGWEAARLLESILRGEVQSTSPVLLPPLGVVSRESSGPNLIANPVVSTAVKFIQNSACESISVSDILEVVDVSRSTMERLFKEVRGRTLAEEIRKVQFERATKLLIESSAPINEIATQCGFKRVNQFCVAFRNAFNCTPSRYRSKYQVRNESFH